MNPHRRISDLNSGRRLPKMDNARRSLEEIGVKLTGEMEGDYGKIAQIADPDGNRITLAEPPARPFNG
jgi:predicted enzyme related to lactoylglutathione lyase